MLLFIRLNPFQSIRLKGTWGQPLGPKCKLTSRPRRLVEVWLCGQQCHDPANDRAVLSSEKRVPRALPSSIWVVEGNCVLPQHLNQRLQHVGAGCEEHDR